MKYLMITLIIVGVFAPGKVTCPRPKHTACEPCEPPTDPESCYPGYILCREEPIVISENCFCPADGICVQEGRCRGVVVPR